MTKTTAELGIALQGRVPGKIIALHLNYPSRMEQRGRSPEHPSYFIKPVSSLAQTGGTVERPAGTELLAFEGEIALIIGQTARWVTPETGWEYVSGVTAVNDLGLYDLRDVDKGSNLRNKGGDGYTPVGPGVIATAGRKPGEFRVRTWVNDRLVQEDTSDTLKFSFGQIVADLSQHLTLYPGDLILTGTPAGSTVIVPGDTVAVEVDTPGSRNPQSTGRLVTTVVESSRPVGDYGAKPRIDDSKRLEAWGDAETHAAAVAAGKASPLDSAAGGGNGGANGAAGAGAGANGAGANGAGAAGAAGADPLTPQLRELLSEVAVATVSAELRKRGYVDIFLDGVKPTKPGVKTLGVAKTLRFIPFRPDLFKQYGGGFNAQKRAFDSVGAGEVLVIEARGSEASGTVGDVLALRAKYLGAGGVVTDGCVRDSGTVAEIDIPVFAKGSHPSVLGRVHVPWETDIAISCGGAAVIPGDIIMGDDDGVIVIPAALLEEVAHAAAKQEREDAWIAEQVNAGAAVDGLFPMNAQWRARYEAETESKGDDGSTKAA